MAGYCQADMETITEPKRMGQVGTGEIETPSLKFSSWSKSVWSLDLEP